MVEILSHFDCGMIAGGLSISETADLLAFSHTHFQSLEFAENVKKCEKQKENRESSSSVGRNALLMREVREEGPDWSKLTGR